MKVSSFISGENITALSRCTSVEIMSGAKGFGVKPGGFRPRYRFSLLDESFFFVFDLSSLQLPKNITSISKETLSAFFFNVMYFFNYRQQLNIRNMTDITLV